MYRSSRLAFTALFAALAAALGFAGALVPNVELISLAVFLGGTVTGVVGGIAIGALAEVVFSLLNPLGPAPPWIFAGQILGMAIVGGVGGALAPALARRTSGGRSLLLGVAGLVVTLIFDLLTNLGVGLHLGPMLPALVAAIPFSLIHLTANTLVFAVLGTGGLRVLESFGLLGRSGEAHAAR